jgi:glycosyltransferase involved in cell wall biosynthesis
MGKPRILLLVTLAERGGAQTYVASLLPALAGRFDVVVAAHGHGPVRDAARAAGVRYVALHHVRRSISPWRDALGLLELVRLMRRHRPQIVHANSSKAGILGRLAAALSGVPIRIFTVHGWAFSAHSGLASTAYRWADRLMCPLTTVTICVAERARAEGLAARTCRAKRTVVIPNALDAAAVIEARPANATPTLVSVGRLQAPKDVGTLLRALAALPPGRVCAVIVGDGPQRAALEAEARALRLDGAVRFAGTRSDVPQLLAAADLFVLSSASEGAPMAVLEAMAAGLPVVASAVGGVPEIVVEGQTGLLVAPGDPAALAGAVRRLVEDPALRRRLGAAGRERVRARFDLNAMRAAHVAVYGAALAARPVTTAPGPRRRRRRLRRRAARWRGRPSLPRSR